MNIKKKFLSLGLCVVVALSVNPGINLLAIAGTPATLRANDSGSRINVRSAPSTQAPTLHYGLTGDTVEVLRNVTGEEGYKWYFVRFKISGAEGWIREDLIQLGSNYSNKTNANLDCNNAITDAKRQIEKVNVRIINVSKYNHKYLYHPEGRSLGLNIIMEGRLINSIWNSPAFLTNVSKNIIMNCSSIGLINFARHKSDVSITYGIYNNRVVEFECHEADRRIKYHPKWGEVICL